MNYEKLARVSRENIEDYGLLQPEEWLERYLDDEQRNGLDYIKRMVAREKGCDDRYVAAVQAIQEFVFGNEGDEVMKVKPEPAKKSETDGWLGNGTALRMEAWQRMVEPVVIEVVDPASMSNYLIANNDHIEVEGVSINHDKYSFEERSIERKEERRDEEDPKKRWKRGFGEWEKDFRVRRGSNIVDGRIKCLGTVHWDVCDSIGQCFRVLDKKQISSVFGIDTPRPDGTVDVFQWLDFGKHYGWHGGAANKRSLISFDLNNLVTLRTKYKEFYRNRVGIDRPIIRGVAHGEKRHFLGMYRGQILACLRIAAAVADRFPKFVLDFPSKGRLPITGIVTDLFGGDYNGLHTHLHFNENKWDITSFEEQIIYLMLKDIEIKKEFPRIAERFKLNDAGSFWSDWEKKRDKSWSWAEIQG